MIKHIVIFELEKDKATPEKLNEVKEVLEALPNTIASLKSIEVGLNMNPEEKQDLVLTAVVDSMDGLKEYATHPDHVKAGALIRAMFVARTCVDYEV